MEEETTSIIVSGGRINRKVIIGVAILVVLVGGFFIWRSVAKSDPEAAVRKEAQELVERVSELILLPEGEDPVIATVADPSQLASTPFFANAKIGDKVLIYNIAGKAVLYDPVAHRIIEVAPLSIGERQQ